MPRKSRSKVPGLRPYWASRISDHWAAPVAGSMSQMPTFALRRVNLMRSSLSRSRSAALWRSVMSRITDN